jgi:hypothetical protein
MRGHFVPALLLAGGAALALAMLSPTQSPAQNPTSAAPEGPVPFAPNMGDLMSILIQPRHAKLGLAGRAQNWLLAGYALKELQQGFATIDKTIPRWRGLPVPELVEAALKQPFAVIDFAIKAGDQRQFGEAFDRVTAGCNACHATTEQSFVVIKAPDASAFPNQEFAPPKR